MKILGWEFKREGSSLTLKRVPADLQGIPGNRGWWPLVREAFTGAWQRNIEWSMECVLAHHAVYACITLISNDIGKLRQRLVHFTSDGIWQETSSAAFSPVLKRPNRYQNHIQFKQWWITSKLTKGNAYGLKARDNRGVVVAVYLLDPCRVIPMVTPDGSIYYQLAVDNLSGLKEPVTVPASEIMHDRMNCLFHPLVGIPPLFAAGMAAKIGLNIERNSALFFGNNSNPGGILTIPGALDPVKADELKKKWEENYGSEDNVGRIAVLADGMKFQPMRMSSAESQLIEASKWNAVVIASTFHVPAWKIGAAETPAGDNIEATEQSYYNQCLQSLIEEYEAVWDEGLGLEKPVEGRQLGVDLDLDGLLRMDSATLMTTLGEGVKAGIVKPNEARKRLDLGPVEGGDTPYLQQQNYALSALAKRDQSEDPFGKAVAPATPVQSQLALPPPDPEDDEDITAALVIEIRKCLDVA